MEVVIQKYKVVVRSLKTLNEALELLHDEKYQEIYESLRDSLIQRFEYSFDTFWKFLKHYLQKKHGISVASPRSILRESLSVDIIDKENFEILVKCLDDRNLTTHTYNVILAEEIVKYIPRYHKAMNNVVKKVQPER